MRYLEDVLVDDYGIDITGWQLTTVEGISADGTVIAGWGGNPDGYSEAWMVIIPEPSTLALLFTGVLGELEMLEVQSVVSNW